MEVFGGVDVCISNAGIVCDAPLGHARVMESDSNNPLPIFS